jgi:hypothetical protein
MDINFKADFDVGRIFLDFAPIIYPTLVFYVFFLLSCTVNAEDLCQDPVGQLTSIEGKVAIQKID